MKWEELKEKHPTLEYQTRIEDGKDILTVTVQELRIEMSLHCSVREIMQNESFIKWLDYQFS